MPSCVGKGFVYEGVIVTNRCKRGHLVDKFVRKIIQTARPINHSAITTAA